VLRLVQRKFTQVKPSVKEQLPFE